MDKIDLPARTARALRTDGGARGCTVAPGLSAGGLFSAGAAACPRAVLPVLTRSDGGSPAPARARSKGAVFAFFTVCILQSRWPGGPSGRPAVPVG